MDTRLSLQIPSRPHTVQGYIKPKLNNMHCQGAWASPSSLSQGLSSRHDVDKNDSRISSRFTRPRSSMMAIEDSKMSKKNSGHSKNVTNLKIPINTNGIRHLDAMPECWPSSRTLRPHNTISDLKSSPMILKSQTSATTLESTFLDNRLSSTIMRPHTTTRYTRPRSKVVEPLEILNSLNSARSILKSSEHESGSNNTINSCSKKKSLPITSNGNLDSKISASSSSIKRPLSIDSPPITRPQSVKSYSSPRLTLHGFSSIESPQQSIFDARSLKHAKFGSDNESPKIGGSPQPSRVKPTHDIFDPSLNVRSPSISSDFKVNTIGPMESLVTEMPHPPPPPPPSDSATHSISPSATSRMLRKQIEAALRMYPRNTWGPITKWGYQEEVGPGYKQHQKDHFIKDKDKLEKQRLEARSFGHQRHWVKFKNATNFWEPHEARQSGAFIHEKDQFLTNSEKMLHDQNDKRIARTRQIEETHRAKKRMREFKRLEKREGEFIDKMENIQKLREDPLKTRSNDSGVVYNIVTLQYPNNYAGDLLRFEDAQIRWRKCMRALRIQSKQSGARMFNVLSWKPKKPCCVPPPKPQAPVPPDPALAPSPRKPDLPLPRNLLYFEDKCEDVPIACTNDNRTNW